MNIVSVDILVVVDYFSTFVFAIPLQEATGYAVMSTWSRHWTPIVGWPLQTYTDNGSHFRNATVMTVFANHGTNMVFAPVSHPASVGLSERMVRMLKQQLTRWAISRRGAGLAE
jgi:transposase InsO family protein